MTRLLRPGDLVFDIGAHAGRTADEFLAQGARADTLSTFKEDWTEGRLALAEWCTAERRVLRRLLHAR